MLEKIIHETFLIFRYLFYLFFLSLRNINICIMSENK